MDERVEQVAGLLEEQGVAYRLEEPMDVHTSFKIGGPAAVYCMPADAAAVAGAVKAAQAAGLPRFFFGRGTNVLFCDEGYRGMVISLAGLRTVKRLEGGRIEAGAGAALEAVCLEAGQAGLAGLEFAYGIPGSVGGALYMNAGAFEGEMKDVVYCAEILDETLRLRTVMAEELDFSYRNSALHRNDWCVLNVTFELTPGDAAAIKARMKTHMALRREKQPLEYPSAGSAFKRPAGAFAGALIDRCGLRGYRVGNAAISEKHCGFIVNLGGATCRDVLELADYVANKVQKETGFELEKEIRVVAGGEP